MHQFPSPRRRLMANSAVNRPEAEMYQTSEQYQQNKCAAGQIESFRATDVESLPSLSLRNPFESLFGINGGRALLSAAIFEEDSSGYQGLEISVDTCGRCSARNPSLERTKEFYPR